MIKNSCLRESLLQINPAVGGYWITQSQRKNLYSVNGWIMHGLVPLFRYFTPSQTVFSNLECCYGWVSCTIVFECCWFALITEGMWNLSGERTLQVLRVGRRWARPVSPPLLPSAGFCQRIALARTSVREILHMILHLCWQEGQAVSSVLAGKTLGSVAADMAVVSCHSWNCQIPEKQGSSERAELWIWGFVCVCVYICIYTYI